MNSKSLDGKGQSGAAKPAAAKKGLATLAALGTGKMAGGARSQNKHTQGQGVKRGASLLDDIDQIFGDATKAAEKKRQK